MDGWVPVVTSRGLLKTVVPQKVVAGQLQEFVIALIATIFPPSVRTSKPIGLPRNSYAAPQEKSVWANL